MTWWIVGRTLRPVEDIRLEVEQISTSELSRRVPVPAGKDEIGRLAATMNRMLGRLESGHDRQRRFVSDASHELRSPVASIRQHAEVARAHADAMPPRDLADAVLLEVERLQGLVDDLLVLAQIDEGVPQASIDVDVDDLVLAEVARLRAATSLDVDARAISAARVRGDRTRLERVVRNLGDNAARHARARVALSVGQRDGVVVVVIDDDGPGIPEDDRARVFERFVRRDEARTRGDGGAGLGLAIVRDVVDRHGGTVALSDSDLGGLRAEVTLPGATGEPAR
jgi:signal transduction histidine kinase